MTHHVSAMGQRLSPTTSWYHFHASGLMGSPTHIYTHTYGRHDIYIQRERERLSSLLLFEGEEEEVGGGGSSSSGSRM